MSDWIDYRQAREIRELQEDLAHMTHSLQSARSSTRRLQSELSKVRGSIEQRLDRLATAFDAFVEISDLRVTLGLFDAHARVRHHARRLFDGEPPAEELSDVDGYWLAPALAALRATMDGRPALESVALARARDARRATLFRVLASTLVGHSEAVDAEQVAEVLPELEPEVPRYQRAMWLLAADGHLGPAGRDLVLRRGAAGLAAVPEPDRQSAVIAWRNAIKPDRDVADGLPTSLGLAKDLVGALDACQRLAVLRHWVGTALRHDDGGGPAGEPDPIVRRTLQALVDEGSPLELPLLVRERELRKVIESNGVSGAETDPDGWESPVGSLLALLREDVVDEEHPGRRALAVRICAPHILAAAEELAERARRPLGEEVQVRTSQGTLTITKAGPVQATFDRAMIRASASFSVDGQRRKIAYSAAGIGAVLVLLGVLAGWGWLIPAAGALAVAGWQLWRDREDRAAARENEASTRARLRSEADECVVRYLTACDDLAKRRTRIDADLAALRSAFTASRGVIEVAGGS